MNFIILATNFVNIVLVGVSFALLWPIHPANTMECGTANIVRPTILGGTQAIKGEWPFIVAIEKCTKYICGGTIITNKHILTGIVMKSMEIVRRCVTQPSFFFTSAAHCIQKKNSVNEIPPHELVVRLGAYNLTNPNETGAIERNVSDFFIHPDWDAFEKRFDADLAILVLSETITFTDGIQPICMPSGGVTENMEGSVVGYVVRRSTRKPETPRRIIVKALSRSRCFREDSAVAAFTTERTFCGGNGDGSPDEGDSGNGYFFTPGFSWAQYGIVTVVSTNATGHVLPHALHIYTNLTLFKDWIVETVNRLGGVVGEAKMNIVMNCDYGYTDPHESVYSCKLHNIDIQGNNFETGSFVGSHLNEETQEDVEDLRFVNGTMTHLPSGFGFFFENIKHLTVGELGPDSVSLGTKVIRRSDFRNLRNLRTLSIFRNDIETLHADALWDLLNLQSIKFIENKVTVLSNITFSKNYKLTDVDFRSNHLNFLPANLFQNNSMLMGVDFHDNFLKAIDGKLLEANRRLLSISFSSNQLETLPERLFQHNLRLQTVIFENNFLSSLDKDLFETNVNLQAVDFKSNRIQSLHQKLFRNSLQLYAVNFDNNSITTIDENLFVNNDKLQIAYFAHNKLEHLQRNVFKSTSLLHVLDLSDNRLRNIEIDYTDFENVIAVNLLGNGCVNAGYMLVDVEKTEDDNIFVNLVQFQNHLIANCRQS